MRSTTKQELREALDRDLIAHGPLLLWSGYGKIPGKFRGLVPETIEGYLKLILEERQRALKACSRKSKKA